MILWIAVFIFIVFAILLFVMDDVQSKGEKKIISNKQIPSDVNIILVLGAGVNENGEPCDMLRDRLQTAICIGENIENAKVLLSGDHSRYNYNEVGTMKKYIMKANSDIKEANIFLDHAGFSTYESICRAKKIYGVSKMIIISNEYHLPRALYIAEKIGIEAYGIKSDKRYYEDMEVYKERELLAQVKDFFYTNILKPHPKFEEKEIPINKSDGRVTDDVTYKI